MIDEAWSLDPSSLLQLLTIDTKGKVWNVILYLGHFIMRDIK